MVATVAAATGALPAAEPSGAGNPFPRWRGFNLTHFNSPDPLRSPPATSDEELKWMVDWGFDFVRLPMAYPRYLRFDRTRQLRAEEACEFDLEEVDRIEAFARRALGQGLHVSLNLHRAPGYCINAGFHEPFDLWQSKAAQAAFNTHWGLWAKRFRDVAPGKISFDLLNEPAVRSDMNDQHARNSDIPGDLYRQVAKGAVEAIRAANPRHVIIADGNRVGNLVTPELKDLNIGQSCRGYYPAAISHYRAPWANSDPEKCPLPLWPGTMGGKHYDRRQLEAYYQDWIALARGGVGVHCGECGCWNKTPHTVFLAWFEDVLDILTANRIGYALWNFRGDFGLLDSRRDDVTYQDWHGAKLDARLLELLRRH